MTEEKPKNVAASRFLTRIHWPRALVDMLSRLGQSHSKNCSLTPTILHDEPKEIGK